MIVNAPVSSPIDGRWQLLRAQRDGEDAPDLVVAKTEVRLAHGVYEVCFAGQVVDRGTFELLPSPATKTMELRGVEGSNAGRRIPCIYQQVGERLRVCYGLDGTLPSEFVSAPGQERYLAVYSRVPQ
jgi:uncharacterized protein (TIGR03067 family)